jgi:protein O-mannosyl-transferase
MLFTPLKRIPAAAGAGLVLLLAAYANHFQNGFHFDDTHAIEDNVFVRDLRYIPRYFVDATTFSVLPLNQAYRPVLQTTLAIDYKIAGGYRPLAFQIDTFVWFLLLLWAMFALFTSITKNEWVALVAVGLFGLHPVSAETVNYVIQRGDLLSTLGVVAALAVYVRRTPRGAAWTAAYLAPFVFGLLAKPPALVFPVLLLVYLRLFERRTRVMRELTPSVAVAIAGAWWLANRTPPTLATGAASPARYLLTQPFVALRYFVSFFAPAGLSADNDWPLVGGASDPMVFAGAAFLVALAWACWRLSRSEDGKPIAFGLIWFFVALLPTSLTPMAEVANDHRMFFAFIGLSLAVVAAAAWLLQRIPALAARGAVAAALVAIVFAGEGAGVHARNEVWHTDEGLWRDVTEKSPGNGRGWMNYGVVLMGRHEWAGAIAAYERALPLTPNYSLLHVNMGVAYGGIGRSVDAERQFLQAIQIAPTDWRSHTYYARWLLSGGRLAEALVHAQLASELNPADPTGPALAALTVSAGGTPEFFVWRSLAEYEMGRFRESLASAQHAIALRPGYAEAFNNVAAAHIALGEWDAGISAAGEALRLNPQLQIARVNLAHAQQQKQRRP